MTWKAIAHSAIGISHIKSGTECQDYGDYIIFDDIIIGAVCDGAGSAKYSRKGAEIAVESTLRYLVGLLKWQKQEKRESLGITSTDQAKRRFGDLLRQVLENLPKA